MEVSYAVETACQRYQIRCVKYDFWQAELMAQQLRSKGVPMSECRSGAGDLDLITRSLLDAFTNRRIDIYSDPDLARDLLRIRVKETLRGFKLTATRDDDGHADRAMALAFALPAALNVSQSYLTPPTREEVLIA